MNDDTRDSGVHPADGPDAEVLRACRDIINAAAVVIINVDFLAAGAEGERNAALAEAQQAVDRIVAIAKALRAAVKRPEGDA